jgi:hypothetical protein
MGRLLMGRSECESLKCIAGQAINTAYSFLLDFKFFLQCLNCSGFKGIVTRDSVSTETIGV